MKTGITPAGLRYAVRRSGGQVAYCALSIKGGTAAEKDLPAGIAHFVEHTVFKGTERHSASWISSRLDQLGGELNAYTAKEEIVLHATVLKEDLRTALDLLLELATCPSFPQKDIDIERGVVIDEIRSAKDVPPDELYDEFEERLFAGNPLSRRILGTAASLRKIKREHLLSYVRDNFRPERMALTVVTGDGEEKTAALVEKLAAKFFPVGSAASDDSCSEIPASVAAAAGAGPSGKGAADGGCFDFSVSAGSETASADPVNAGESGMQPAALDGICAEEAVRCGRFDIVSDKRNHEANAILGGPAPSLYQRHGRIVAALLANILGGPGSNSLLNAYLRDCKGWVYAVECSYTQYARTGIMAVLLGCEKENLDNCLAAVRKVISEFCEKPMSETKLRKAKKQMLGQLEVASDNGEAQCLSMGKSLLSYGRVASSEETRAAIDAVTAEDLQEAARRIFSPDRISTLVYL